MAHLIPIPFLVVTATLTVLAYLREDMRQVYLWKPLSTVLIIVVALLSLLQPDAEPAFTLWVVAGLILSLGGDVALMFRTDHWFRIGLVLFLLAQIVYAIGFTVFNGFHPQDLITGVVLLLLVVVFYRYLRPGLGRMKVPVLVYMLVISFMVNRAISTFFGDTFTTTQAWLLTIGASLFWLSDLLLAINRFRRPFRLERLGLFLYFAGQLLIALSPSYF